MARCGARVAEAAGANGVLLLRRRPDRADTELEKLVDGLQDSVIPVTLAADGEVICL